jgi:hypothetical protein
MYSAAKKFSLVPNLRVTTPPDGTANVTFDLDYSWYEYVSIIGEKTKDAPLMSVVLI